MHIYNNKSCAREITGKEIQNAGGLLNIWKHDLRIVVNVYKNIRHQLTNKNSYHIIKSFEDARIQNERIIKEKTGRKRQDKMLDIREWIMELPESYTADDIERMISASRSISETPIYRYYAKQVVRDGKKVLDSIPVLDENGNHVISPVGFELIAVLYHGDEGNWLNADGTSAGLLRNSKGQWVDLDGIVHNPDKESLVWKRHNHCHPWFNVLDKNTGKAIRLAPEEMSQIQTIVAEELGMERGKKGSTARHLKTEAYSEQKALEAKVGKLKMDVKNLEEEKEQLIVKTSSIKKQNGELTQACEQIRTKGSAQIEDIKRRNQILRNQDQEHEILCQKISESANMGPYAIVRKYEALRKRIFDLIKETINEDVQEITLEDDRFNVTAKTGIHLFVGKLGVTYFVQGGQRIKHRSSDRMQHAFAGINKDDIIDLFAAYAPPKEVQHKVVRNNGMHL